LVGFGWLVDWFVSQSFKLVVDDAFMHLINTTTTIMAKCVRD
jgi:hypothetical protein